MSRHRNIRNTNYDEDYAGYDDVYGHSVEDDSYCVSPSTADQFLFQRSHHEQLLSSFMKEQSINEEEEEEEESDEDTGLGDSRNYQRPQLNPVDEAKLQSCLDEIRNIVGDTVPDHIIIDNIVHYKFNFERALDAILNQNEPPKKTSRETSKPSKQGIASSEVTPSKEATSHVNNAASEEETIPALARLSFPPTKESDTGAIRKTTRVDLDRNGLPVSTETAGEGLMGATSVVDSPSTLSSSSSVPSMPRVSSKARLPTIDVMAEYEKRQGSGKDLINLVVIGHVDAGKSTLMGHLLFLLGNVNKRTMHKYEQESKKAGKASFAYAWVLDETGEERERGITMDVGLTNFETSKKIITLLDAPGHKDFIPNMITGAAQADVAILVVDASRGEFEAGFESGGQTREHAMLVRSLGVTQLAVAVNKLDNVGWSQERYNEIVAKLGHFLKQAGFKESEVAYIPCSGLTGENLVEPAKEAKLKTWYSKDTLVQQIDKFKQPKRPIDKPFRLCVSDVFKGMGSGFSVAGKIVSGNIQANDRVLVRPAGEQGYIKTVLVQDEDTKWGCAGDYVTLTLIGIDQIRVNVGSMLCSPSEPIKYTTKINARVIIFNIDVPITKGYPVVFHYQTLSEPAVIKRLISLLHKSTGEVIKKKPRCLTKQSNAVIGLETARPVCVELYKDYKDLGRFMLRTGGATIAAGVITEIL